MFLQSFGKLLITLSGAGSTSQSFEKTENDALNDRKSQGSPKWWVSVYCMGNLACLRDTN